MVSSPVYFFFYTLFRWRFPDPGGTPLSFLVEDEISLLHVGDAHRVELGVNPDILCLPWRTTPFGSERYKRMILTMVEQLSPKYVIPIHLIFRELKPILQNSTDGYMRKYWAAMSGTISVKESE